MYRQLNSSIEIAVDRISQHMKITTFDLKREMWWFSRAG